MATDPTPTNLETIPGISEVSEIDPLSVNALDALFTESGGNPKAPEEPLAVVEKVEPKVKETPKPDAPPVKEAPGTDDVLDDAISRAIKDEEAAKEKPVVVKETPAAPVADKDEFDSVELPPNVKPKTVESFTQLKNAARERVAAVSKQVEDLTKEVEALKAKTTEGLPKEVEAELKSLREFRAKLDVEADPAFLSFDKTVADNTEAIYAKLLSTPGIDAKQVQAIRDHGGPGEVDWDGPGIKLPGQLRRFIDAKLVENESVVDKKTKAIADAKTNAEQYLSTRRDEHSKGAETQNKAVETEIEAMLPKFPWFKELKAKEGASAEDKTAIENHNKLVADATAVLKDAVTDNSPAMRSVLAVGYAQLLKTRADFSAFKVTSAAKEKQLTTDLEAANTLIAKIKKSSTTRLRDSAAEEDGGSIKSAKVDLATPGTDALDKHLAAIQAAKE